MTSIVRTLLATGATAWLASAPAVLAAPPSAQALAATAKTEAPAPAAIQSARIIVDGRPIVTIAGIPSYPAETRAALAAERIRAVARDGAFKAEDLRLKDEPIGTVIMAGAQAIFTVHDLDAQLEGVERETVAMVFRQRLVDAIVAYRDERTAEAVWRSVALALLALILFAAFLWVSRWLVKRLIAVIEPRCEAQLKGVQAKSFGIIGASQMWTVIENTFWTVYGLAALCAGYLALTFSLNRFPWTRRAGLWLKEVALDPLHVMASAVADSIPNLAFIALLLLIVRFLLKAMRLFFVGVESGAVTIAGFYPEWSATTYRLARFGVIAFTLVVAYPYIPGSSTEAFKGVSVFVGVLFSLGASSILANTLAGYTLIYRRAFKVGDRVKVGEHLGDIVDLRAQVTTLRTPKNEHVIIPNSTLLSNEIVNYSSLARAGRLILHSAVTIGYDAPWRQVQAMLLEAARRTEGLLKEPAPFVLQKSLDDFYVTYEINAYCDDASRMAGLYSGLHENIQDVFNEYGVQIMSPNFEAQPDRPVVVPKDMWFAAPARPREGERKP
jgi:small-conductance mechanosensitive channel